jgi:hypothetical protein
VPSHGPGRGFSGGYRRGYAYGRYYRGLGYGYGSGYGLASVPYFYDNYWQGDAYDGVQTPPEEAVAQAILSQAETKQDQRHMRTAPTNPQANPKVIDVPGAEEPSSAEQRPAIFIFSNGNQMEARRFTLTADTLVIDISSNEERRFPLTALNLQATISANQDRGIALKIPQDRNQISLGF